MQKVVVVTGASRGLGLALTQEFAANGWHVVGIGRSTESANFPDGAEYRQLDASDPDACAKLWQQLYAEYPDAEFSLVNNAGGYVSGSLTSLKPEDYTQQMQSNYFSAVFMTRGLAMTLSSARIINIVSSSALGVFNGDAAYGSAKAATKHFFQVLQQEYAATKYRITNLYLNNIASHGVNPAGIAVGELAQFVRMQAESGTSYYLRDVTLYPMGNA